MWAENCPATSATRAALVGAEIARLEGRELDAMRLYEAAVRAAQQIRFKPARRDGQSIDLPATLHFIFELAS